MKRNTPDPARSSLLLRRFSLMYIGFSLVPFALIFYLYTQYVTGDENISVPRDQLSLLTGLVGLACLIGFFGMRSMLLKIALLADNMRKSLFGKMDKSFVMDLVKEDGEVAELAKSFGQIFGRLEDNIRELEETKRTLYEVLTKVSEALSSMENLDKLVKLILETAVDALGADNGAIFSLDESKVFTFKAWVGPEGVTEERISKGAASFLDWVAKENRTLVLPSIERESGEKLFEAPLVCAPLLCRDKLLGAVCLSGHRFKRNYTEEELKIVSNLSYQIALSFENVQLNKDMEQTYFETMSALALAVEARDPYSRGHSERVGILAAKLGRELGLSEKGIQTLRDASRLHDIGKIGITDSILIKPGPLSEDEREIMKRHPTIGESIVKPLKTFHHLLDPIRHHHERLDGSGYPDGLKDEGIPLITRIMAVADICDALIGDRPYRKALSLEETKQEFDHLVTTGKLDEKVVGALYALLEKEDLQAVTA